MCKPLISANSRRQTDGFTCVCVRTRWNTATELEATHSSDIATTALTLQNNRPKTSSNQKYDESPDA